jgi:hypothetical protein
MLGNQGCDANAGWTPIERETPVYDVNGGKIGSVEDINRDTLVLQKGMFFPKDISVPLAAIHHADAGGVYLGLTKDQVEHEEWGSLRGQRGAPAPQPTAPADMGGTTPSPARGSGDMAIPVREEELVNAPVHVTYPTNGAAVPLPGSDPLTIRFDPSTLDHTAILAVLNDSQGKFTVTLPTRETGALTVKHDQTQDFQPGPGLISLARVTTRTVAGTAFHQDTVEYDNITAMPIIWQ